MIEKLKDFGQSAKNFILFIVGPLVIIFLMIVHYILERKNLQDEASKEKLDVNLERDKAKEEDIDAQAKQSQTDYDRIRDAYRNKPGNS